MSAAGARKTAADESLVYVYGVARIPPGAESAPLQLEGIIPEAPVQRVVHGSLAAFVSPVPASRLGADELRVAPAKAEWLHALVLAHERVLKELRFDYDLVPFRFCAVYRDAAQVSEVLARHQAELAQALDRIKDAAEWGVKMYCNRPVLRRQVEVASRAIWKLRKTLTGASLGAQFFLRKKYNRALDAEVASSIAMCVEHSCRRLDECAREAVEIAVQSPAVHGRSEAMLMNAAYLVENGVLSGFQRTLAALKAEFAAQGFAYELTGPWPAYHFVSSRPEGNVDAAASDQ